MELPKREKREVDALALLSASVVVVAAFAVIFSYPGWETKQFGRAPSALAATAVTVTNGGPNSPNNSFPGAMIPASSPEISVLKVSVTASQASQTLTSATVNFSGTGFATSDLAAIATGATSGVALYTDHASSGTAGTYDPGTDPVVTLAASPNWTPSTTNITLTPATPVALPNGTAKIFYVAIKTSGTIVNNDEIRATVLANGVVTSDGNGPTADFVMNYLRADTAAVAISSVEGLPNSNILTVRFNKPVRKYGATGGNIAFADTPFTFTDLGTTGSTTITAIAHTEGQNFATVTLSDNLDSGDFDGTPSTLAAGTNKIADFGGTAVGTGAVPLSSPLTITTNNLPSTNSGAAYTVDNPLVTFASQGGTGTIKWRTNSVGDSTILNTTLGLTSITDGSDNTTGKLFGTIPAGVTGSFTFVIKATDSAGTPVVVTKTFTLNVASSSGGVIPGITNVSPPGGAKGATNLSVTITGANTTFSGSSAVTMPNAAGVVGTNGITFGAVTANSATSLTVPVTIAADAIEGSRDVRVTTGNQVVTMPNGFNVFAAAASGLNLLLPGENATNVQMPPGFSFNPSANASVNSYRITLKSTSNFAGLALWDYAFPKPADVQNTNGSHCNSTSCNLGYGAGTFRMMTQPTPLVPNTTYYWQVRTYSETMANVSDVATPLEQTPVRGFTTVSSLTDVTPPQIMHRPVFQATASTALNLFARVNDNIATASTTPPLTPTLVYCKDSGSACTPGTSVNGTPLGNGYYRFTIPNTGIDAVATPQNYTRYYLQASDGTNIAQFKGPSNQPFVITPVAAPGSPQTITGTVVDSACSPGVQSATVFIEGSGISATTNASCIYTLSGVAAGTYDLVAFKDGYSEQFMNGIAAGSSSVAFRLWPGSSGGFGGDTTRARVKFTGPMDGMTNMPGSDSNFRIFVVFDKAMSQSTITATNLTVKQCDAAGCTTDITSRGTWTYYATAPVQGSMLPPEANLAAWTLTSPNVLGDNKTIAVSVSPGVTDTSGNVIQGNQSDGSYVFSFTTGSTANFSGFNSTTGTFSGGGTFGTGQFVPPHVEGTTPPPGAFAVPTNSKVVINFSEAMADDGGGYLLKDNVKLFTVSGTTETDVSSTAISTVALDTTKRVATVTLLNTYNSGTFLVSTSYRLKVLGGAKAATGLTVGPPNMVASSMFQADFKTGTGSDTAAPTVQGSYPDTNATNVPVSVGAVSVGFSKDMNASTLTTSTFYLSVGSTAVNGTVEYDPIGRQALFIPKSALSPSTSYTVNFTASIQGLNGQAIAAATRTFTTGSADTLAPNVAFVNADDYNLAITFSEPMSSAKATETTASYGASVLKPANFAVSYGAAGFASGTAITIPATASFSYDAATNTVTISGYHSSDLTSDVLRNPPTGGEILVTVTNVKDLSGNPINTSGGANAGRAPIMNSATTKGALGPGAFAGDAFSQGGSFTPTNFSSTTFGFAPPIEVRPFNMMAGQTTIYGVRIPISRQISAGGQIVLTFPTGFDVSGAKQDVNSPMRTDLNGPGTGTPTFKCAAAGAPTGASCSGTANTDDAGAAQGGLAGDGIVVNTSSRTVTVYISADTNATNDFLTVDIAGIKNSTVPKDFNTTGYTVDVKTKNGATQLESLTSMPFFVQGITGTAYTLSGTITLTGNDQNGTMKVYLMSPMTGPLETDTLNFNDTISGAADGATAATYSFTNLTSGDYMLFTDQTITLGTGGSAKEFTGKTMPERVVISEAADIANSGANDDTIPYNFTLAQSNATGTTITVAITGGTGKALDVFAGSPNGFKVKQVTPSASPENVTIKLTDGQWFVGVGPQMPKGMMAGPPPVPDYLPPKPVDVRVVGATVTENSGTANDGTVAFTLAAASKSIRGTVKDGANKIMANAEVYAYSPTGGMGTHAQSDAAGAFTLGVTDGSYVVGAFVPGMPPSKEVPVTVTSHATIYLLIDGATTAITPAAAATSFILKVAKPDYTISGKVTDGTNVVQGASVYAYRNDGPGHANALTDSSGAYTLYVSNGTWKVGTFLPQYGNLSELTVTINGASASNQNFSPSATGTFRSVSGTVTSGGTAVQGAFVRISGNGTFNETITGSDGTYSFKVPEGNGYVLRAFLPGTGESAPLAAFNVSGADVTGKNIVVATPRTVTVTFSTAVTKAFVELFSSTGVGNRVEITNAVNGTLQVPDGSYTVRVDVPGIVIGLTDIAATSGATVYSNTTGIVTVADGNEGLTVTMPTLRTISGTVKDGSNNFVGDAWVDISSTATGVHFGTKSATSDGTFSLSVAGNTTYNINAMKPGYFREPSTLAVAAANVTGQVLTMNASTLSIAGQILIGSSGAANAFVRAEKQGGGFTGTQADANGTYTLPVTSGTWRVFGVAEGYAGAAYAQNPITVGATSVTDKNITLTTAVTLNAPKTKPMTPASGGTLEDSTAGVKLTIPANALGTSTSAGSVEAKETNNVRETSTAKPLKSFDSSTGGYVQVAKDIKATDSSGTPITNLNDTVTVEMTYTVAELAATASAADSSINTRAETDTLKMAYWDETTANWVTKPTTITYKDASGSVITDATAIDTAAEFSATVATVTIAGATDHFSLYAPVVSGEGVTISAPAGLAKSSGTTTSITMTWNEVSGATSYDIYRSSTSGGTFTRVGSEPTVSAGSTTTYTDSGLSAGTTYYYKITSLNAVGESAASAEVSMATSAVAATTGGGGGTMGFSAGTSGSASTTTPSTPPPSLEAAPPPAPSTDTAVRTYQVSQLTAEAADVAEATPEQAARAVGAARDSGLEQRYEATIVARVVVAGTPAAAKAAVLRFVTYGTPTTTALGAGERAGVVGSFRAAYGRVPGSPADWEDVLKIANGRWPSQVVERREQAVAKTFRTIYRRAPDLRNARDDAAIKIMAYGLRSVRRDLNAERAALKTYRAVFRRPPQSAGDWDAVRAVAYSGTKR